jgi:hypothetical protein
MITVFLTYRVDILYQATNEPEILTSLEYWRLNSNRGKSHCCMTAHR